MSSASKSILVSDNNGLGLSLVADFGLHTENTPIRSNCSTSDLTSAASIDVLVKDNWELLALRLHLPCCADTVLLQK